mmetsp:Transcript_43444/g.136183  ORF Transcript_43444/g.136183 Transcript_43444/m.136183 type:complete len:394 (-) Transcript_43444:442-1623(-)
MTDLLRAVVAQGGDAAAQAELWVKERQAELRHKRGYRKEDLDATYAELMSQWNGDEDSVGGDSDGEFRGMGYRRGTLFGRVLDPNSTLAKVMRGEKAQARGGRARGRARGDRARQLSRLHHASIAGDSEVDDSSRGSPQRSDAPARLFGSDKDQRWDLDAGSSNDDNDSSAASPARRDLRRRPSSPGRVAMLAAAEARAAEAGSKSKAQPEPKPRPQPKARKGPNPHSERSLKPKPIPEPDAAADLTPTPGLSWDKIEADMSRNDERPPLQVPTLPRAESDRLRARLRGTFEEPRDSAQRRAKEPIGPRLRESLRSKPNATATLRSVEVPRPKPTSNPGLNLSVLSASASLPNVVRDYAMRLSPGESLRKKLRYTAPRQGAWLCTSLQPEVKH